MTGGVQHRSYRPALKADRAGIEAAVDMLVARVENPALGTEKRVFSGELLRGTSARIA